MAKSLETRIAELEKEAGGLDPFDHARWNVGGDFWWYQTWLDHAHQPDLSALEAFNGRKFAKRIDRWPAGKPEPPKPAGWDVYMKRSNERLAELFTPTSELLAYIEERMQEQKEAETAEIEVESKPVGVDEVKFTKVARPAPKTDRVAPKPKRDPLAGFRDPDHDPLSTPTQREDAMVRRLEQRLIDGVL